MGEGYLDAKLYNLAARGRFIREGGELGSAAATGSSENFTVSLQDQRAAKTLGTFDIASNTAAQWGSVMLSNMSVGANDHVQLVITTPALANAPSNIALALNFNCQ